MSRQPVTQSYPRAGTAESQRPSGFRRLSLRSVVLPVVVLGLLGAGYARRDLPPAEQYSYLARILTYDRNLKERAGDTIVIGILYQSQSELSRHIKEELSKAIDRSPIERIRGLPVRYVSIDLRHEVLTAQRMAQLKLTVVYVTPMTGIEIGAVTQLCRTARVPSVTGVAEHTEKGIAIGILHDGLDRVFRINLSEAKRQGADFSSQFLKIAQVRR